MEMHRIEWGYAGSPLRRFQVDARRRRTMELAAAVGMPGIALEVGLDQAAPQDALASALGLGSGAALGDIRAQLHARGQDDLAALLPDERAGNADELLEQLIGLGG